MGSLHLVQVPMRGFQFLGIPPKGEHAERYYSVVYHIVSNF